MCNFAMIKTNNPAKYEMKMSIWKSANFEIVGRIAKRANFKLQKLKADVCTSH
jgi:hypothetical protein